MNLIVKKRRPLFGIWVILLIVSCNSGPKITMTSLPKSENHETRKKGVVHEVVVKEILPANQYTYAKVKEGRREYWIATGKQTVQKDSTYFYAEALLKTSFESKEHERVFDTLYLVNKLLPKDHGFILANTNKGAGLLTKSGLDNAGKGISMDMKEASVELITIAELVQNPRRFQDKIIELSGKCVKVNAGILQRNWIHLRDGSQDDFDLVITSEEEVAKGATITVRGIVRLDQDFGSGYSYPILVEEGTVIQ
ncbi:hypothetical protein FK220_009880 [Flavobacteriaceae bacterium TP-CH-4]|uniref:Uncharacterized protein n=1 Tax=Pelagihabitans pacificus TaxID=2696054 RepID=A0A967AUZ2_9FLAO|nr:hypothetical protein [Pelagihabitans pacificus]NHF59650.1 hypothetical protein [Pelagihabitans pacificus]